MTTEELVGILVIVAAMFTVAGIVGFSRLPRSLKVLVYAGLAVRILGSWLRYTILLEFYRGSGDAPRYYQRGLEYAERFWRLDFTPFVDSSLWIREQWWGTQFVSFPSSLILAVIGPSLRGEFLAFSLLAFLGLVGFVVAFRRAYPHVPTWRYAMWIWLFPSLWYWPSSVGKEAIVLLGLGLAIAGFIGRGERINWVASSAGVALVFAIRPQVAAVVMLSFILAHSLSLAGRWTPARTAQTAGILVAGLVGIQLSMHYVGVGTFDVDGVQSYLEAESAAAAAGGSAIESVGIGWSGVPIALVNILFRPFLWEASNPMMLISAVEILAFWIIVFIRRRNFVNALRTWRSDRFLRVAVPFLLIYSITLGLLIANLGIIARQRVFLFPFLFLLLEAAPARASVGARSSATGVRYARPAPSTS